VGRPLSDLVSVPEASLGTEPREGFATRIDGERVTIEIAARRDLLQGEEVTVVAVRDIERRKRDEEENRQLQRQLLHSQKMEAIGRLSAGVAHDFNNCLLAIFGFSDFLLGRYAEDERLVRTLTGIREAAQRAASLTKQLLAFTRQQPMEPRVVSLNDVVSGVEEMVRQVLGRGVELVARLAPDLPPVRVDPVRIEQVVLNMAVNARDAMPRGGRLTLETDRVEFADGATPHPDLAPGAFVRLRLSDTGIGMDAETQARVFEPFFSTKRMGEGTGLGLSTAYGIVKQSGGHVTVASQPNRGATFSIFLPAVSEAAAATASEAAAG
jgi:signal transduction histidine kinase